MSDWLLWQCKLCWWAQCHVLATPPLDIQQATSQGWQTNKQANVEECVDFESLWVSRRMAELKMNSLELHNPFCSIKSRAKSWGYKWASISWHSSDHDVPLGLGAQFIWQKNETIQYSHFLTKKRLPVPFPWIFWGECEAFHSGVTSEWNRTQKMVSLFN